MSHPKTADLPALIRALIDAGVELIVVGGAASVLHGAMLTTNDLDVVPCRNPDNLARLAAVLEALDAIVREPGERRLRPTRELVADAQQLLLRTAYGPLDILNQLHDGRDYEDLLPFCELFRDGGRTIRAVDLPTLIEIKLAAGRPKDQIAIPHLLALLRERETKG